MGSNFPTGNKPKYSGGSLNNSPNVEAIRGRYQQTRQQSGKIWGFNLTLACYDLFLGMSNDLAFPWLGLSCPDLPFFVFPCLTLPCLALPCVALLYLPFPCIS